MAFDPLSMNLTVASLIVGVLTYVIVGSQTARDARTIATGTFVVLVPLLLASCARLAFAPGGDRGEGGPGMVVLGFVLILSVRSGRKAAERRQPVGEGKAAAAAKKGNPEPWDDEFGI